MPFKRFVSFCLMCLFIPNTHSATTQESSIEFIEQAKKGEMLILDVRSPEEYADGHVPGAINIPHNDVASQIDSILKFKTQPVVVYCRSGYRATKAMKVLSKYQFEDIRHLDGDMQGWRKAGLPEEK